VRQTELQTWLSAQSFLSAENRKRIAQQRIPVVSAAGGVTLLRYNYERPLTLLFATSLLVLLIAAANLANLLLARTEPAQVAIQTALGASSWRLIQQALTEGLLLSAAGAAIGLLVASIATRAAVSLTFDGAQYLPIDVHMSATVIGFAFGLALVTGVLFSAAPAWAMARTSPGSALAGAGRSVEQRSFLPRRSLVIAQVAMSLVLLAGAGLLTRSLQRLEQQPLGFSTDGRVVARVSPFSHGRRSESPRFVPRSHAGSPASDSRCRGRHILAVQPDGGEQLAIGHQHSGPGRLLVRIAVVEPDWPALLRDTRHSTDPRPHDRRARHGECAARRSRERGVRPPLLP
jgi:hypothetical protein